MASENRCGQCGAVLSGDAPATMCPGCLLRLGVADVNDQSLSGVELGHYIIEKRLGSGGMATVYLARDNSLRRHVALKFLSSRIDADPIAQRRFLREARAAAALDHPYICHIHEVAEADGRAFIAMEYIGGVTLRRRLADSPLTPKEAVRLAAEIAEALEKAHSEGIVHRDLKPGNVMITQEGHAKVMDFGLAKRLLDETDEALPAAEQASELTEVGTTLGTLAYMSPEQVKGRRVDARSDIFSFGTLLYEMLTGVHPFARELAVETAGAIVREPARPLTDHRRDLPKALVRLVERMLEKDPDRRPQSAREVGAGLRAVLGESGEELGESSPPSGRFHRRRLGWISAGLLLLLLAAALLGPDWFAQSVRAPSTFDSLAVLPFDNLTGDAELDFVADGITEGLIRDLSGVEGLHRVAPLDSVRVYQSRQTPDDEMAEALDVGALVDGSVEAVEAGLTISVRARDAASGRVFLERDYTTRLADLAQVQAQLSRTLAAAVGVTLNADQQRGLAESARIDPEAHAAFMRGRHLLRQRESAALDRAIGYFHEAIAAETSYAAAFEGLADAYLLLAGTAYSDRPPSEVLPRAVRHARRALELDPQRALAHTILAQAALAEPDWATADEHFQRARRLAPSSPRVHQRYSLFLAAQGRLEEAENQIRRAVGLDPVSASVNATLARILYYRRDPVGAVRLYRETMLMDPGYVPARLGLGLVAVTQRRGDDAVTHFEGSAIPEAVLVLLEEALAGRPPAPDEVTRRLQASQGYVSPFFVAVLFAVGGDAPRTVRWLEEALEDRSEYVVFAPVDPVFDPVLESPQFQEFKVLLAPDSGQ